MAVGRPRTFDFDEALDRAVEVFWQKGYEGTSLPDLTKAMGINRPSLYAAFGNKESLFRKALDRYGEGPGAYVRAALAEANARAVADRLLFGTVDRLTDAKHPPGCLLVQGALSCSKEAEPVRRELAARRMAVEVLIRNRFRRAIAEGDLAPHADPTVLARYVMTVVVGLGVQAAGSATRAQLRRVAAMAMQAFPSAEERGDLRTSRVKNGRNGVASKNRRGR